MRQDSIALSKKTFFSQFGLNHNIPADIWTKPWTIELGEGDVHGLTRAAQAVLSKLHYDPATERLKLTVDYWRMQPDGSSLRHNVFDLDFHAAPGGDAVTPQSVWVMGLRGFEADGDDDAAQVTPGLVRNLGHIRSAIQYINLSLRNGRVPNIADIIKKTGLQESMGHRLALLGQKPDNAFDFAFHQGALQTASGPVIFPADVAAALVADDINTLDENQRLGPHRIETMVDPRQGVEFATEFRAEESRAGERESSIHIDPIVVPSDARAFGIPDFAALKLKKNSRKDEALLKEFKCLGVDLLKADHTLRMQVIGVVNRVKHALRQHEYPKTMDYFAEYDLLDWADERASRDNLLPPPPDGRMVIEAKLGHNTGDEVVAGYGHKPDGNCTVVEVQWKDKEGRLKKIGAIQDLGLSLPEEDVANKGAIADVIKHLKYVDHIFLTHDHLDHKSGFVPYIAKGLFKGKTIYGTEEQIISLRHELEGYDYPKEYNPVFVALKGRGCVHIKDGEGVTRLSVVYSAEGTPHTARCTPYMYVARNGPKIVDTYLNAGDARFGEHNTEGYAGEKPEFDYLDKYFFQHWGQILADGDPSIERSVIDFPVIRADFDGTSILKHGFAPSDFRVKKNRNVLIEELGKILPDRHIGASQISTNEMGLEAWLGVADEQERDVSMAGANIERKARLFNTKGVNKHLLEARRSRNIQLYLDKLFWDRSTKRLDALNGKLARASGGEREALERAIGMEETARDYFTELRTIKASNIRMARRDEFEAEFKEKFGESRRLGSLYATITSNVSRRISTEPGRWLTIETGTQGSFVEIDSTFSKRSEGRSRYDMRADERNSARPLPPEKSILFIAQTAIPGQGKEKKQDNMRRRLMARGYVVVTAAHDGCEIDGLTASQGEWLKESLATRGFTVSIGENGALSLINMPIHAPGHGYVEDVKAWLKLVDPVFPMLQHTGDRTSVTRFKEVVQATLNRLGFYFENFERVTTVPKPGSDDPREREIVSLGRSIPSLITVKIIRKIREYYRGHIDADRHVKFDGQGGMGPDGMMASITQDGTFRQHFASVSSDVTRHGPENMEGRRPESIPYNRQPLSKEERIYRGPKLPTDELYKKPAGRRTCII